ncbi:MAG: hypothetical protein DYH13_01975 [Alphaproteobacteria bacterium PRO2]|nr:hypothetical protein [Alphaproteobacteria bacterium PRO2]
MDQAVITNEEAFARLDKVLSVYGFTKVFSKPDMRDEAEKSEHPSRVKSVLRHRPREVHPKASVWNAWKKRTDKAVITVYASPSPSVEENWDVKGAADFLTQRFEHGAVMNKFKPLRAYDNGSFRDAGGQVAIRVSPLLPEMRSETSARNRKHITSLLKHEGFVRDNAPVIGGKKISETWSKVLSGHAKEIITFNRLDKEHRDMIRHLLEDIKSHKLYGIRNEIYTDNETLIYQLVTDFENEPVPVPGVK